MLALIILIDGLCMVLRNNKEICKGGISAAYAELIWQGVQPEEICIAFRWFAEHSHDVAYFGINKTCLFTKRLVPKKQRNVA